MRISAVFLAILLLGSPSFASAIPDIPQQVVPAKIPDFLMKGTYKLRATDPQRKPPATYSGSAVGVDLGAFGISNKNLLLTAAHNVVDDDGHAYGPVEVEVVINPDSRMKARVWAPLSILYVDPIADLALASVDIDLPYVVPVSSEDNTVKGDVVAAVGYPGGGGLTVTFGHLVSKEVENKIQEPWEYQASFPIYFGNSGGAAFDVARERVIGIVVSGYQNMTGLAPNMAYFVGIPKIKAFLDTRSLRKKLDSMIPSKEGNHERAPAEGNGVPQGVRDNDKK